MADIYDFNEYRCSRLQISCSQEAEKVAHQFCKLREAINRISVSCDSIKKTGWMFCSQLDAHLLKLKVSKEFTSRCSAACELKSIDQMLKKRDQLIRDKHKKYCKNKK